MVIKPKTNINKRVYKENIRCLQINLMRSRKATDKLCELLTREKYDIILIQEPYCISNKVAGVSRSYRTYQKGEGRKRAAVIVTDPMLDVVLLSELSDEDAVMVEIHNGNGHSYFLASMYLDLNCDINQELNDLKHRLDRFKNSSYIICMDSNCRAKSWFDKVTNERGRTL